MRTDYRTLFYLKFKKRVSTYELVRKFPDEIGRVSEVALLEIPEEILREVLKEEKLFDRLMRLKRKFLE